MNMQFDNKEKHDEIYSIVHKYYYGYFMMKQNPVILIVNEKTINEMDNNDSLKINLNMLINMLINLAQVYCYSLKSFNCCSTTSASTTTNSNDNNNYILTFEKY